MTDQPSDLATTFGALIRSLPSVQRMAMLRLFIWIAQQGDANVHLRVGDYIERFATCLDLDHRDIGLAWAQAGHANTTEEAAKGLGDDFDKPALLSLLIGLSLADGQYDARQRTALRRLAFEIGIGDQTLIALEHSALQLIQQREDLPLLPGGAAHDTRKEDPNKSNNRWILAGAVAGGAILTASGFIAAPAIGGIIGSKALGLSGAAATSAGTAFFGGGSIATGGLGMAGGKAVIAGLFGLGGAALGGKKAAHRTGELKEFRVEPLDGGGTRVVLGISGFLSQHEDFGDHWSGLRDFYDGETIKALRWESKSLTSLGATLGKIGATFAARHGGAKAAAQASRAAASTVGLPLFALAALNVIDNPWSVARDRADKAGRALADVLRNQPWGSRPVTLVGFSLGTRVLVHALSELTNDEIGRRIESVYLLGGAVAADCDQIDRIRHAVSGPIINGFCHHDWVLKYLYRAAEWETPIGLAPLERDHILDVDLNDIVDGHLDYNSKLPAVLDRVTTRAREVNPETWISRTPL